jgi:hypothetical protein
MTSVSMFVYDVVRYLKATWCIQLLPYYPYIYNSNKLIKNILHTFNLCVHVGNNMVDRELKILDYWGIDGSPDITPYLSHFPSPPFTWTVRILS